HMKPFRAEDLETSAHRTAEAWMLMKLVLLKQKEKVDVGWTAAANSAAQASVSRLGDKLDAGSRQAVTAIACRAGLVSGRDDLDRCSTLDLAVAHRGLDELAEYVAKG